MLCCMVIFLSGCSDLLSGIPDTSTPTPTFTRPTTILIPVQLKGDSQDIPTESLTRSQLEKVQSIMAGMSLDQKLGQLIVVEYIGNNYQSGLQDMISQQFVGGYMYQESNHNFGPPYDVVLRS